MRSTLTKIGFLLLFIFGSTPIFTAATALDPAALQIGEATVLYHAQRGDTLGVIAEKFTTNSNNWVQLAKLNNVKNDRAIPIGTVIVIPVSLLPDDPSNAKVAAMSGNVEVIAAAGHAIDIEIGTILTEGSIINTGNNSFLTLVLPDQSHIALPSNSRIKLAKLRLARYTKSPRTEITLLKGRVESEVSPLNKNKGRFEVRSPLAVAGVRGTNFRIRLVDDKVITEVLSGGVTVGKDNKITALTLHDGQGNITDIKGVGKAIALLPEPHLADHPERQERATLRFTVNPVPGAHAYRAQISTDADARNIVDEVESNDNEIKFNGLDDGNYFLRIAAIDQFGLQGIPHVLAFKLKVQPEPPFNLEPKNKSRGENVVFSWTEIANAQAYHLQVAGDAKFNQLVINEPAVKTPQFSTSKLAPGHYFWRVATIVNQPTGSDQGPFGDSQSFILLPAVQVPKITDVVDGDLSFRWTGEPEQKFIVEIGRDTGFSALLLTQQTSTPEITVPRPATGTYFIRVKAIDPDGYVGPFSSLQKVVIGSRWVTNDGLPLLNFGGDTFAGY